MATGALFMLDGFTYAAFSPFWGWLLDRGLSPVVALAWGNVFVVAV